MVKTLTNIWLTSLEPCGSSDSLDSSNEELREEIRATDFFVPLKFNLKQVLTASHSGQSSAPGVVRIDSPLIPLSPLKKENRLVKCVCLIILNDCVHQLSILSKVYTSIVGEVETRDVVYKDLVDRFKLREREDSFGDFVINAAYTNLHKLLKEIRTVIHVLNEVGQELALFGGISSLELYIDSVEKMSQDEKELLEELYKKEDVFKNLDAIYKNYRSEHVKKCKELDILAREFVGGMKDDLEYAQAEKSFTQRWEMARREQNTLVLRRDENKHNKMIKTMEENVENENRIHKEFRKYLEESTNEYLQDIEHWMETYDKELDGIEMDIYSMKNRIDKVKEDRENLEATYEIRAQQMEDYLEHKRQKIELLKRRQLEISAACKIQAWWREVMFVKKLGPYKKKKKTAKGNKKKGAAKTTK